MFQTTRSIVRGEPGLSNVNPTFIQELYRLRTDGTYVGVYGIGQSIVGVPAYLGGRVVAQLAPAPKRDLVVRTATFSTNALIAAIIAVVLLLVCLELGASFRDALVLTVVYSFGTFALPASKAFGSELGTALCLLLACWGLARLRCWVEATSDARRTDENRSLPLNARRTVFVIGVAVGSAALFRLNGAIFIPIVGLGVLASLLVGVERRSRDLVDSLWFGVGLALPIVVLGLTNLWRFGSILDAGYAKTNFSYPVVDGVENLLFSPGKSLFLYAPVTLLSVVGLVVLSRKQPIVAGTIAVICAVHLLIIGQLPFWSGDAAWGPRYLLIILPVLVAACAPLTSCRWGRTSVAALGLIGFLGPALLGSLIYFNMFLVRTIGDTGSVDAAHETLEWNPFLGHIKLVVPAIRDLGDTDRPNGVSRGEYSSDPADHYRYYSVEPRIDFWWLWIGPSRGSAVAYLLLALPTAGLAGALIVSRQRWPQVSSDTSGANMLPTAESGSTDRVSP